MKLLRILLSEPKAVATPKYLDEKVDKKLDGKKDYFATKQDVNDVKSELNNLKVDIREMKSGIVKWMFIFWISQLWAIIAIIKLIK